MQRISNWEQANQEYLKLKALHENREFGVGPAHHAAVEKLVRRINEFIVNPEIEGNYQDRIILLNQFERLLKEMDHPLLKEYSRSLSDTFDNLITKLEKQENNNNKVESGENKPVPERVKRDGAQEAYKKMEGKVSESKSQPIDLNKREPGELDERMREVKRNYDENGGVRGKYKDRVKNLLDRVLAPTTFEPDKAEPDKGKAFTIASELVRVLKDDYQEKMKSVFSKPKNMNDYLSNLSTKLNSEPGKHHYTRLLLLEVKELLKHNSGEVDEALKQLTNQNLDKKGGQAASDIVKTAANEVNKPEIYKKEVREAKQKRNQAAIDNVLGVQKDGTTVERRFGGPGQKK